MEAIACQGELEGIPSIYICQIFLPWSLLDTCVVAAQEDCSHITDADSLKKCIDDILAAGDCGKCLCDVIPALCGKQ